MKTPGPDGLYKKILLLFKKRSNFKQGVMDHAFNPCTIEVEARESRDQGQPGLHRKTKFQGKERKKEKKERTLSFYTNLQSRGNASTIPI
jgi:hypothetical protein